MGRSTMCLLLLLASSSLVFVGVAGMALFGPPTFAADSNGQNVTVNTGATFWIKLPENPTAGYSWDLTLSDGLTKLSDKYESADRSGLKVGVGGTHSYEIKAMKNGSQAVTGIYRQAANQSSDGMETYSLNVRVAEGGLLSGLLGITLPVMDKAAPGISSQSGDMVNLLIRPGDNEGILSTRPPMINMPVFPIMQTGMSATPLSADRNQRSPQDHRLKYTDVPPADTVNAKVGDLVHLTLPENPSTGYSWQMTVSDGIGQVNDNYIQGSGGTPGRPLVGAGGTHEWTYKVTKPGTQAISGIYKRPWESDSAGEKTYVLNVNVA